MRRIIIAFASLSVATSPAFARDEAPEAEIAKKIADPVVQEHVAEAMSGALGAVLDMRIGALERAIDPRSEATDDDTVRDRIGRDDPDFEERMGDRTRAMTGAVASVTERLVDMLPALRNAMGDLAGQIGDIGARMGDITKR